MNKNIDFYNIPIVDYLTSIGEPIVSIGRNYWQHTAHDSLKINSNKNYFVWNSRLNEPNAKGGVVQYLQIMHNLTLSQALSKIEVDLTGTTLKPVKSKAKPYPKVFTYKVSEVHVPLEAQRYLVAERKIPNRIVRHFFALDLISQNENKEIIFKWHKGNEVVGFNKQGTQKLTDQQKQKHFTKRDYIKYVSPTTEEHTYWGFNYLVGQPKHIYFFEAAIDLLSYYAINEKKLIKQNDFWLIAIDGVALEKIIRFISYGANFLNLKEVLESLHICFDNDQAGIKAFNDIQELIVLDKEFINELPKKYKDWNEVLKMEGV